MGEFDEASGYYRTKLMGERIDQVGFDWNTSSSSRGRHRPPMESSKRKYINLILVDGSKKEDSFDIPSSNILKSFFSDYAEKRSVSLRSLRFSYKGKTMFLSSVGNKSPEELNMQDHDVITVHDTRHSASQETSSIAHEASEMIDKKNGALKKVQKRHKCKSKKKRIQLQEPGMTLEEHKRWHSTRLSKVHEEVQPRLKTIRTRLHALQLNCQAPKQRKTTHKKNTVQGADLRLLPQVALSGKAGRSYYAVRVGEENHLYRTNGPSRPHGPGSLPVLDVHGLTREEALVILEESLKVWVDTALKGSYPFVIPAMIVCGGGNQILSETVQKWIKSKNNICNAPKNSILGGVVRHTVR